MPVTDSLLMPVTDSLPTQNSLEALHLFRELLGMGTFFVPNVPGTKHPPQGCSYKDRSLAETLSPTWLAWFNPEYGNQSNIAIKLGGESGHLCAIDFDRDEDLTAFLDANPLLQGTLRTKGARGAQVWVRIQGGEYPKSGKTAHYEWRANGNLSTIYGQHKSGVWYSYPVWAEPMSVAFDAIAWPEDWDRFWEVKPHDLVEKRYGPPLRLGKTGNATINQRFIPALFALYNHVVFDLVENEFYLYDQDGGLWERCETEFIRDRLCRLYDEMLEGLIAADVRFELARSALTDSTVNAWVKMLRDNVAEKNPWRRRHKIIHAANGMLDFNETPFSLKDFSPEWRSRNATIYHYRSGVQCQRFLNELLHPAVSEEDALFLQKYFGVVLMGRNDHQIITMLTGTGGAGKGTLCKVLFGVLGRRNIYQLRMDNLDSRFEMSFYYGKSLLYGADVPSDFLNRPQAHVLKSITGGDYMSGEVKGVNRAHDLVGDYHVLLTCNSRLLVRLQGDISAWSRRLRVVDFPKPPASKRINNFDELLLETEGEGIFAWMIQGAQLAETDVKEHGKIFVSPTMQARIDRLLAESDSVNSFIMDVLTMTDMEAANVTIEEVAAAYRKYCDLQNFTPLSQRVFSQQLEDLLFQKHGKQRSHRIKRDNGDHSGYRGVIVNEGALDIQNPF
ncbi:MAG: hypothetical protein LBK99_16660 [Opitutaceae bacterium]|jgi:P4 family phage/plasmid primase-like protien|nr:hypothetical protein [Opitutaceae bacterium]